MVLFVMLLAPSFYLIAFCYIPSYLINVIYGIASDFNKDYAKAFILNRLFIGTVMVVVWFIL